MGVCSSQQLTNTVSGSKCKFQKDISQTSLHSTDIETQNQSFSSSKISQHDAKQIEKNPKVEIQQKLDLDLDKLRLSFEELLEKLRHRANELNRLAPQNSKKELNEILSIKY